MLVPEISGGKRFNEFACPTGHWKGRLE